MLACSRILHALKLVEALQSANEAAFARSKALLRDQSMNQLENREREISERCMHLTRGLACIYQRQKSISAKLMLNKMAKIAIPGASRSDIQTRHWRKSNWRPPRLPLPRTFERTQVPRT